MAFLMNETTASETDGVNNTFRTLPTIVAVNVPKEEEVNVFPKVETFAVEPS